MLLLLLAACTSFALRCEGLVVWEGRLLEWLVLNLGAEGRVAGFQGIAPFMLIVIIMSLLTMLHSPPLDGSIIALSRLRIRLLPSATRCGLVHLSPGFDVLAQFLRRCRGSDDIDVCFEERPSFGRGGRWSSFAFGGCCGGAYDGSRGVLQYELCLCGFRAVVDVSIAEDFEGLGGSCLVVLAILARLPRGCLLRRDTSGLCWLWRCIFVSFNLDFG